MRKCHQNRLVQCVVILVCLELYSFVRNSFRTQKHKETDNQASDPIISWIDKNPLYSTFEFPATSVRKTRKRVNIVIIVSSAAQRFDRRRDIRATWWTKCRPSYGIVPECIFMTDYQEPSSSLHENITLENELHGDIRFQKLTGGLHQFGLRYLYHIVYVLKNYHFDYFLRMDDDYFFCIQQFFMELPRGNVPYFHWGYTHCVDGGTRPDESMVLLSRKFVMTFAKQNPNTLKCHPFGGQMIGKWAKDLNMSRVFRHDKRLQHHPPVRRIPHILRQKNICSKYIGIHGCYPPDMLTFWRNRGPIRKTGRNLKSNSKLCMVNTPFNARGIERTWVYEAKPCILKPRFNTTLLSKGGFYKGRQNT